MTDPAAARSGAAPQQEKGEMHEDHPSRVAPSVPCVAPTGSTAEPSPGAVTAAERPETNLRTMLELDGPEPAPRRIAGFLRQYASMIRKNERWDTRDTMAAAYESAARVLETYAEEQRAELAALAAARLALQQELEKVNQGHTAWLVALGSSPPQWWTGRGDEWTDSVDGTHEQPARCAIRFARREDAERAIGWLLDKQLARGCRAEEHLWL